ncbi:MAG: long-chain fatty acid--CoA ligase [Deltaproteobacteria bacterium]|nr:long-chain fatty acid--CoA ligase [Candidatus Anaeroferrophillacea bacterium]
MDDMNLVRMFFSRVEQYGDERALMVKRAGRYADISWREWGRRVECVAGGLMARGVQAGARVALLSENRPEWSYADLGILSCGAANVPIYPTSQPRQISYIINNSESAVLFVSTNEQLAKALQVRNDCPSLGLIVSFTAGADLAPELRVDGVVTLDELAGEGEKWLAENPAVLSALREKIGADDLATVIYTSGTTGDPKGVMLTHDNFYSNCAAVREIVVVDHHDVCLSHLPLSHVLERMAGYYLMIYGGATIAYAEAIDTVPQNLEEVKPTLMVSVPRLFEKIYDKIMDAAHHATGLKKKLMFWAFGVAERLAACLDVNREPGAGLRFEQKLAEKLVFTKLTAKLGGRMRFMVSGGAPLPRKIAEFFYGAGCSILEGYGLTETAPVLAVNTLENMRFGTVGLAIPGVSLRIAEDGEILARGPNIAQGYFRNPEATAEAFVNGWFHTGDVGKIDAEGYLSITDRKKDLIVTAGGKNIAPQHLENLLKMDKYISEVMLYGDRKKFISALVVPDYERIEEYALTHDVLYTDVTGLIGDPEIVRQIERRIAKVQDEHDIPPYERVKKFVLMAQDFSMEAGEVTPTLKLRRKIVTSKFQQQLDALYEE